MVFIFFVLLSTVDKKLLCLDFVSHKTGIPPNRRKTKTQINFQFCCPVNYVCKHWRSSLKPALLPEETSQQLHDILCHWFL